MALRPSIKTVGVVPSPEPQATIDTSLSPSRRAQANGYDAQNGLDPANETDFPPSLQRLYEFADDGGNICHMLDPSVVQSVGTRAVREWESDNGSRERWKETAERSLRLAAQEDPDGDDEQSGDGLWPNSADIHYPLLTTASQQFAARAGPELVKGDQVVGVKVFNPPQKKPRPSQIAANVPPPQDPQTQQAAGQALQAQSQEDHANTLQQDARQARAERVKHYLNWQIFYQMDGWEADTDLLLHQIPITGSAFKKVYMGTTGLCSDYVSALRLTVHNDTKSLHLCPRITEDFEVYPNDIEVKKRAGIYNDDVELPAIGEDPQTQRLFIEQQRLEDLDEDGFPEPYIVTVDVDTKKTMGIIPAYTKDDIHVNLRTMSVVRIDRWNLYSGYLFLPDPRGKFYGIGFGRLLESITDSVDTSINQLLDAGTAEIAGGGFIGSSVRLQGSGQGGAIYFRPGEYQTVGTPGGDLRQAIWERTVPHPSAVTFQLLELLLAAAKDIASVKDVITGNAPSTAPVGTTLALQQQALQVFSAIYKRVYRGFKDEFRLMYRTLKRWATDEDKKKYAELTGGNFDEDFGGDGTDIQPVADPSVVTKMQKITRIQTVIQLAESQVGQAAGMLQPGPAQKLARNALDVMDIDDPDGYVAEVPPNPLAVAKAADMQATAQLKTADAHDRMVEAEIKPHTAAADIAKMHAESGLTHAKSLREIGLAAVDTHELHKEADRVARTHTVAEPETLMPPEGPQNAAAAPT